MHFDALRDLPSLRDLALPFTEEKVDIEVRTISIGEDDDSGVNSSTVQCISNLISK